MARILVVTWAGGGNVPPAVTLATELARARPRRARDRHRVARPPVRVRRHPVRRPRAAHRVGSVRAGARRARRGPQGRRRRLRLHAAGRASVPARRRACRSWRSCTRSTPPTSTTPAASTRWGWPPPSTRSPPSERSSGCRRWPRFGALLDRCATLLVTCPESLDVPSPDRPAHVRYVGPLLEPPGADAALATTRRRRRPPARGGRAGHHTHGRAPGAAARGHRRSARLPVRGHRDAGRSPRRLPTSTCRRACSSAGYVRHTAMLPWASAVVTHAGLGTVLAGLVPRPARWCASRSDASSPPTPRRSPAWARGSCSTRRRRPRSSPRRSPAPSPTSSCARARRGWPSRSTSSCGRARP